MSAFTNTSSTISSKTIVACAVLGGLAIAAMAFFGWSSLKRQKQPSWNDLTPGYWGSMDPRAYQSSGETPVIEEQKLRVLPNEPIK